MFIHRVLTSIFTCWMIPWCALLAVEQSPPEQESAKSGHGSLRNVRGCAYDKDFVSEEVYIFESDEEARKYIRKIARSSGVADTFEIHAADVSNAMAIILGEKRYILYNQTFMEKVRNAAKTNWAGIAILAHEIGHHLNGHELDGLGSRPRKEIEADIYTGFALAQMGATLEQAQSAMAIFPDPEIVTTHPKKAQRLAAIANGWKRAKDIMAANHSSQQKVPLSDTTQKKKPSQVKVISHPVKPIAEFSRITANWNQDVDGRKGFHVIFNLDVQNVRAKRGRLLMTFHTSDGRILRDANGAYASQEGHVVNWMDLDLLKPGFRIERVALKFPFEELHLDPKGSHTLYFELFYGEIAEDGSVTWIAQSQKTPFTIQFNAE